MLAAVVQWVVIFLIFALPAWVSIYLLTHNYSKGGEQPQTSKRSV